MIFEVHNAYIRSSSPARLFMFNKELDLATFACPICEGSDKSVALSSLRGESNFVYLKRGYCSRCEHYYVLEGPSARWHESYYTSAWCQGAVHGVSRGSWTKAAKNIAKEIRDKLFRPTATNPNVYLALEYISKGSKIIELGAGNGRSLLPFKHVKMDCFAVEPSMSSARLCEKRGIKTFNLSVQEFAKKKEYFEEFNLVFSNHSLEHYADPNDFFELATKILRKDGFLLINIPNGERFDLISQTFTLLHPQNFTEKSLGLLFAKYGFKVLAKIVHENLVFLAARAPAIEMEAESRRKNNSQETREIVLGMDKSALADYWKRKYDAPRDKALVYEWGFRHYLPQESAPFHNELGFTNANSRRSFTLVLKDEPSDAICDFQFKGIKPFAIVK